MPTGDGACLFFVLGFQGMGEQGVDFNLSLKVICSSFGYLVGERPVRLAKPVKLYMGLTNFFILSVYYSDAPSLNSIARFFKE